jgi:hypothetical protein
MSSTHHTLPGDSRVGHPRFFLRRLFFRSASGPVIIALAGAAMIPAVLGLGLVLAVTGLVGVCLVVGGVVLLAGN